MNDDNFIDIDNIENLYSVEILDMVTGETIHTKMSKQEIEEFINEQTKGN